MSRWREHLQSLTELSEWLATNLEALEQEQEEAENSDVVFFSLNSFVPESQSGEQEDTGPTTPSPTDASREHTSTEIRRLPRAVMALKMGEDLKGHLLTTLTETGFPSGYEIRKTQSGRWGLYGNKYPNVPICYAHADGLEGYVLLSALLAGMWCAHSVFSGELDPPPGTDYGLKSN